ncbi:hypothetical protein L1887_48743 [Cichorium endivia]|nr:hypothetical protein L1887_48743 [Cichorium endivia]
MASMACRQLLDAAHLATDALYRIDGCLAQAQGSFAAIEAQRLAEDRGHGGFIVCHDTGLFALPFCIIVIREWLKVRGEGADEGNKGVLSLARIETNIYVGYVVVAFFAVPAVNVSFDTLAFDQSRAQQCQYNLPKPADTGWNTTFSSLAGKSAQMPMWWAFMHALSKGLTNGAVAAIPCGTDLRQVRMEVNNTKINNPLLAQEIGDFTHDCYGPSRARLFMRQPDMGTKANDPQFLQDLSWIGSHFLLNTSGYYDTDYSKTPRTSWPYNASRDVGLPQVSGGGGYPTCKQWWSDSGVGLRDRIKDQVSPDLMTKMLGWAKWLSQDEVTDSLVRQLVSPSNQVKGDVYTDYGGQINGTVWNGAARATNDYGVLEDGDGDLHPAGTGSGCLSTAGGHDHDGGALGWAGISAGKALEGLTRGTQPVEKAGSAGADIIKKAI